MLKQKEVEAIKARYLKGTEIELNPNVRGYLNDNYIPYDYWYTPAIENDIHTDFSNIPEDVKELAGELFQNQQQGSPAMKME